MRVMITTSRRGHLLLACLCGLRLGRRRLQTNIKSEHCGSNEFVLGARLAVCCCLLIALLKSEQQQRESDTKYGISSAFACLETRGFSRFPPARGTSITTHSQRTHSQRRHTRSVNTAASHEHRRTTVVPSLARVSDADVTGGNRPALDHEPAAHRSRFPSRRSGCDIAT